VRSIFLTLCLLLLVGCSKPVVEDQTVDGRPGISIHGAHRRAMVYVDGLYRGRAREYGKNGKVLLLEPGIHYLEIVHRGSIIFTQQFFLDRDPRDIYVP
jgi:hypothetical protein